jgi:hypothetical protein
MSIPLVAFHLGKMRKGKDSVMAAYARGAEWPSTAALASALQYESRRTTGRMNAKARPHGAPLDTDTPPKSRGYRARRHVGRHCPHLRRGAHHDSAIG